MDPITSTILISILANVLTDVVKVAPRKIKQNFDNTLKMIEDGKKEVSSIIDSSLEKTSIEETEFKWYPIEEFILFLQSEEVGQIIRQLFCYNLYEELGEERPLETRQLCNQFIVEYKKFFSKEVETDEAEAIYLKTIFSKMINNVEEMLSDNLSPELRAYESLEIFKKRIEFEKLNEIQKELKKLKQSRELDVKDVLEFEKTLRFQLIEVHGKIIPPSFSDTKKLPIDSVYVSPNFYPLDYGDVFYEENILNIFEFISDINKTLVLGNPGAGKTTLTEKICFELAINYDSGLVGGKSLTPIHITIRKYGEEKSKNNSSIKDFIETTINSIYQLRPPKGAIDYILSNGRAIVIFDGLDELLEVGIRREIVRDIEAFLARYPFIKVLVTSREIGYSYAPFSHNKFQTYKIAPFNEDQIKEYVHNWFSTDSSLNANEKTNTITSFLNESQKVPDLSSNPLMLSLMCILYKGEGYIPSNRPDLYEKCSKMLFETWDRRRNIGSYAPFEDYFRSTLMYIANWVYNEESNSQNEIKLALEVDDYGEALKSEALESNNQITKGFDEKIILRIASEYLSDYFDTYEQAENYAQGLIDFCKNRAWVFTDVGEDSYNFTHRTFLEYFAANYLVRKHTSIENLVNFIAPKAAKSEWFLVSQLAIQIKNQSHDKAADEIIERLIEKANKSQKQEKHSIQLFICSCLQFINFSTKTRLLIFDFIKEVLVTESRKIKSEKISQSNEKVKELLEEVSKCNSANRITVNRAMQEFIIGLVESKNKEIIKYAILLTMDLPNLSEEDRQNDALNWNYLSRDIKDKIDPEIINSIVETDLESALIISSRDKINLNAIQKLGASYLVNSTPNIYSRKLTRTNILTILSLFEDEKNFLYLIEILDRLGEKFLENPASTWSPFSLPTTFEVKKELILLISEAKSRNAFNGLFWLLAILYEKGNKSFVLNSVKKTDLRFIFAARDSNSNTLLSTDLDKYPLNESDRDSIWHWVLKKINFLNDEIALKK